MLGHKEIRKLYSSFWESKNHKEVPPMPLVPANDPTTLFTGSGMQQFVPYLLGETHPLGTRLFDIQPCIRSQDIEEVGDNRHTTCFEMIGNWSLGDYFKKEQLEWIFYFLTNKEIGLGLDPKKIFVTVFTGDKKNNLPGDSFSIDKWKELFKGVGIDAKDVTLGSEKDAAKKGMDGGRIFGYTAKKNWWSRAGIPDNMPAGEPGGPCSEIFYEFSDVEHDTAFGEHCHPNCDCGRYTEIGNNVFMQYKKNDDGTFSELPKPNIDFGGGLERLASASYNSPDVFVTDLFQPIIKKIILIYRKSTGFIFEDGKAIEAKNYPAPQVLYESPEKSAKAKKDTIHAIRIIADHVKGASMLINIDIFPSNKEQGYVVRRLLRRAIWMGRHYLGIKNIFTPELVDSIIEIYGDVYPDLKVNAEKIKNALNQEETKFSSNLEKGIKELPRIIKTFNYTIKVKLYREEDNNETKFIEEKNKKLDKTATGDLLFYIYESFGFPPDLTTEMLKELGWEFSKNYDEEFQRAKKAHQDKSRSSSAGKFKGGLADNSEQVVKYHTATHLLHQALFDVLGTEVKQEGSNITGERLRFDFKASHKPTEEEVKQIEKIINDKISQAIPVQFKMMPKDEAEKVGAKSFFKEKYPDTVKVYFVGTDLDSAYSKEFCGGPHVENTKDIGSITIKKIEKIGSGMFRMYAQ